MSFKAEMKREIRNIMKDVEKEAEKVWKVTYKGHLIEVKNQMKEEVLMIDGVMVDQNKRTSLLSHLFPYIKLSGALILEDGTEHRVSVKLGGYLKFNCTVKIDNKKVLAESEKFVYLPWNHKEKLVPFIQEQLQENKRIVSDDLPDDEYVYDENHPRMVAGLSDQVYEDLPTPFHVKKMLRLLEKQLSEPSEKTRRATYEELTLDRIVSYREPFIEAFQEKAWDEEALEREALWLMHHAADREVLKFALILLGLINCDEHRALLTDIGMHEEFTDYVCFALKNGVRNGHAEIEYLAKNLSGWGKIAAVTQLEARTPKLKEWLLMKGYQNDISDGYLAFDCIEKGELAIALEAEEISKQLYDQASFLIQAVLNHQAANGEMEDYSGAGKALTHFVRHAKTHCQTLKDYEPLTKIKEYLQADMQVWEERLAYNWCEEERLQIEQDLGLFVEDPKWLRLAVDTLEKEFDPSAFAVAQFCNLDVTQKLVKHLAVSPNHVELYEAIMETEKQQYVEAGIAFAASHFTLTDLSKDEMVCMQVILQRLYMYEGLGLNLIQAGLESSSERLQYEALTTLEVWEPILWQQPMIQRAIQKIAEETKDLENKRIAKQLLKAKGN